jgi:hypothetical protein
VALGNLAGIADLLAAIGVIAFLIYGGYQVKQTRTEKIKLNSFFSAHVRHCQSLFYQQQQGLLDEYFSYGVARTVAYWIKNYPWAAAEWTDARKTVPADFAHFVDTELEEHPEKFGA